MERSSRGRSQAAGIGPSDHTRWVDRIAGVCQQKRWIHDKELLGMKATYESTCADLIGEVLASAKVRGVLIEQQEYGRKVGTTPVSNWVFIGPNSLRITLKQQHESRRVESGAGWDVVFGGVVHPGTLATVLSSPVARGRTGEGQQSTDVDIGNVVSCCGVGRGETHNRTDHFPIDRCGSFVGCRGSSDGKCLWTVGRRLKTAISHDEIQGLCEKRRF
jgi:hypothetical protein